MTEHRIFTTSFASVHPQYAAKTDKKQRGKAQFGRPVEQIRRG